MECYKYECKDFYMCDKYKKAACLFKVDELQYKLRLQIFSSKNNICSQCNNIMIPGKLKYSRVEINLCTRCSNIYKN